VVDAAVVLAEVGVLQRVFKCGMNPSVDDWKSCLLVSWSLVWYKFVEFVGVGVDRRVSEEGTKKVEGGLGLTVVDDWFAGHDRDVLSSKRVFMLCTSWKSAKSSGACRSSSLTHESCAGEYPFHLTRYCFFFHRPYVCALIICSTSHSSLPSMISGGGLIKLGPC